MADTSVIRWGILGTGGIARKFAADLQLLPDATLHAVGSRAEERANTFGDRFDVPQRYGAYADLAADPDVDIVYVATPHPSHHADARVCLAAGKAVLCEKPFTLNADEAADLIALARERGLFLMEAMWTRFLPVFGDVQRLLDAHAIGEVQLVQGDICAHRAFDAGHRLFNPELGGGALLDLGVYPISLASQVLGPPDAVTSSAVLGATGVDEQSAYVLRYDSGAMAVLAASFRTNGPREIVISGTGGRIRIHARWWCATTITIERDGQDAETIARPYEGHGYQFEAAHAMDCLRAGRAESPVMPLGETLQIMQTLDRLRAPWGLVYPGE
ncbi:MAG: Gfo/Idh/MocA family oxidoreductase [Bacteroidetes bacterium]|jgi:predicted dehydrogenase|nr:Gfo/Idh/MocA family oxidoreductase [Bacteroidota bacterium]